MSNELQKTKYRPLLEAASRLLTRNVLGRLCQRSESTISRWLGSGAADKPPQTAGMKNLQEGILGSSQFRKMFTDSLPHFMEDLKKAIEAVESAARTQLEWTEPYGVYNFRARLEEARQDISSVQPHQVRENFSYEVRIVHDDRLALDGFRLQEATLRWNGRLPDRVVWLSYVNSDDLLRREFLETGCIYREVARGVDAFRKNAVGRRKSLSATLSIDDGPPLEAEYTPEDNGILRAYFRLANIDLGEKHKIHIESRSPLDLDNDTMNIKFDGYFVVGECSIAFTPNVPLKEVRKFESTGSNRIGSTHDTLWQEQSGDGANKLRMTARKKVIFPGSGVLFKWPVRHEVLPIPHGDLDDIATVHKRSREAFGRDYEFLHNKPPLEVDFLFEQQAQALLVGLYDVFRRTPDSGDQKSLIGFALSTKVERMFNGKSHGDPSFDLHLEQLSLLPELQGRRLGQLLVHHMLAVAGACGAEGLSLITFKGVPWCGPNYLRLGFHFVEETDMTDAQRAMLAEDIAGLERAGATNLNGDRERRVMLHSLGKWRPRDRTLVTRRAAR